MTRIKCNGDNRKDEEKIQLKVEEGKLQRTMKFQKAAVKDTSVQNLRRTNFLQKNLKATERVKSNSIQCYYKKKENKKTYP